MANEFVTGILSEYSAYYLLNQLFIYYLFIFTLNSSRVIVNNFIVFLDVTSHFCLLSDSSALITSEGKLTFYANWPLW